MSSIKSYHNLAAYSPGSYINALQNSSFDSLAQQAQCSRIISQLQRLNTKASLGEAWCPILRSSPPNPIIGTLICINIHRKGKALHADQQEHVRKWISAILNDIPIEIPQLYIDNMPPSWELRGDSWGLAAVITCISSFLQQKPVQNVLCSGVLCLDTQKLIAVSAQNPKRILCSWEAPQTTPLIVKRPTDIDRILKRFLCGLETKASCTNTHHSSCTRRGGAQQIPTAKWIGGDSNGRKCSDPSIVLCHPQNTRTLCHRIGQ